MIRNRVSELLGKRKQNVTDLARGAGISRNSAHRLYHESADRIDLPTLEKVCRYFGVDVGGIFYCEPGVTESVATTPRGEGSPRTDKPS